MVSTDLKKNCGRIFKNYRPLLDNFTPFAILVTDHRFSSIVDGPLFLSVALTCPIPQYLQFSVGWPVNHTSINIVRYIVELFSNFTVANGERSRKPDALRHSSTSRPRYYIIAWVIECTSSSFAASKEHERNDFKNKIKEKDL